MANIKLPPVMRSFDHLEAYDDLDRIILHTAEMIANQSPYDTGNLRINAIRAEWLDTAHTAFRIYIDESALKRISNINYQDWLENSPRSPHRGWFARAAADAENYIRSVIG